MIWGRLCHAMPCLSEQRNNETKRASLVLGNDSLPVHSFAGDVGCLCMFSQKLTQSLGIVSSQSPCFLTGAQGHDWANSGLHGMAACFLPSRVLCTIFSAILFGNLCAAALSLCFVLSAIGFAALFCYSLCLLQGVVSFLVCFFFFFFLFLNLFWSAPGPLVFLIIFSRTSVFLHCLNCYPRFLLLRLSGSTVSSSATSVFPCFSACIFWALLVCKSSFLVPSLRFCPETGLPVEFPLKNKKVCAQVCPCVCQPWAGHRLGLDSGAVSVRALVWRACSLMLFGSSLHLSGHVHHTEKRNEKCKFVSFIFSVQLSFPVRFSHNSSKFSKNEWCKSLSFVPCWHEQWPKPCLCSS